jgi:hypothetical protein
MATGSTYNAAQHATYDQMAAYLSSRSGLNYQVALNWLRAEGSTVGNNPLGLTSGHPAQFIHAATWQAALDASIQNLFNNPAYKRVVAAIRGRDPAAQRAAIIASPWAEGNYNHGSSFSGAGIPGYAGGSSAGPAAGSGAYGGGTSAGGGGAVGFAGAGGPVTILQPGPVGLAAGLYPIPRELIGQPGVECSPGFVKAVISVGPFQTLQGFVSPQDLPAGAANACVRGGTAEAKAGDPFSGRPSVDPGAIAGPIFSGLFGWVPSAIADLFILALILILAVSGGRDLLGD